MIKIYPTLVWYYYICQREVWLEAHKINPDEQNDYLELGRLIHATTYQRERKEITLGSAKFDIVSRRGNKLVIGEIKKSSKYEEASTMQLAYYLYLLKQEGLDAEGELRYPKEKKTVSVILTPELEERLQEVEADITSILTQTVPPPVKKIPFCKNCAYREFCYS